MSDWRVNQAPSVALRDQIAMSIVNPCFTYQGREMFLNDEDYCKHKQMMEWQARYKLADMIIKECRTQIKDRL